MKLLFPTLVMLTSMSGSLSLPSQAQAVTEIGGQKVITLSRTASSTSKPEFTSVTLAPGRGMEVLQITANFPGKGNKTLTTEWQGHSLTLPANNIGHEPGAERHAMHGLILKAKTENVTVEKVPGGQEVSGIIHGGNFDGHWFSKTDVVITVRLTADAVDATIVARNTGSEPEPMAIAWHPYFNLPSGDRTQARLRIPAATVAEVDNYDNVFPTGKVVPVKGTKFDMSDSGGTPLASTFFDDNWSHLNWENKAVTVQVIDPAAHYGVKIEGLSPEIKAIQVYAPPAKSFVAIEHQYNFGDPFGKVWGTTDTGMVTLKPGQATTWHVRLKVFVP